jgi:hypothetical protein
MVAISATSQNWKKNMLRKSPLSCERSKLLECYSSISLCDVYQVLFFGGEKWTNGDTRPQISGEFFPFSQKEFAKLPPILGSVLPPVYLLATNLMILYQSTASEGQICLNLSGDTCQCCYSPGFLLRIL